MANLWNATHLGSLVVLAILSACLTGLIRAYALQRNIMDIPNARSSHTQATPRGGGLAIVLTFLTGLVWFTHQQLLSFHTASFLGLSGLIVALTGFLDDHRSLGVKTRLLAHSAGAGLILYLTGLADAGALLGLELSTWVWPLTAFLTVLALVWVLNLTNFMDGINGITCIQIMSVCLWAALCAYLSGRLDLVILCSLLIVAAGGFLPWNFPKGSIFMGDVGSGFLGLMIGALTVMAQANPSLFWAMVILMALFYTDATTTLFARWRKGEDLSKAHRSHAYQYAARGLNSHIWPSLCVGAVNLFVLGPLAISVVKGLIPAWLGMILAYGLALALYSLTKSSFHRYGGQG
jgi:Fuc2NAc and GlcNAc transferase